MPASHVDILGHRLQRHRLLEPRVATAPELVRWMGAVQAQDYGGARWAVAQRGQRLTAVDVDTALATGAIVRTHVLRPTWHLVAAADLRWMLELTAPRVKALAMYGNRQSGLDAATLSRSNHILAAALRGRQLTRVEVDAALRGGGVLPPDAIGLGRLLMAAELDGVICSGALRGKQHTYALLEERVPPVVPFDRDVAVAELAARYYASHGPATVRDFAWWSGLSVADATAAVHQPPLQAVDVGATRYWSATGAGRAVSNPVPSAHLLPNFDEYTVGYADRTLLIAADDVRHLAPRADIISNNVVIADGRVVGTWKRVLWTTSARVSMTLFHQTTALQDEAITSAVERYAAFIQLPVEVDRAYWDS